MNSQVACRPLAELVPPAQLEEQPDRLGELLVGLADLVVEARARRLALGELDRCEDPRIQTVIGRLRDVERHLVEVGAEAASVHNELRHSHLI